MPPSFLGTNLFLEIVPLSQLFEVRSWIGGCVGSAVFGRELGKVAVGCDVRNRSSSD